MKYVTLQIHMYLHNYIHYIKHQILTPGFMHVLSVHGQNNNNNNITFNILWPRRLYTYVNNSHMQISEQKQQYRFQHFMAEEIRTYYE